MQKVLVIYNPVAGSRKIRSPGEIIKNFLRKKRCAFDFFETVKAEKQPLDPFSGKCYDRIIVAGGDGTVAEVISFLVIHKIKTPLIILPQGSANILALSLGISLNISQALKKGFAAEGKLLDVMKVNHRYYGMIATGCGYDTLIMRQTTRGLKRKMGGLAYIWTILKTVLIYREKPYKLYVDGKRETVTAKTIIIFNAIPFGRLKIMEQIGIPVLPNDGLLNIFAFNPRPIRDFLRFKKAIKVFRGKKISVKAKKEYQFQIDGNVFRGKAVTIEIVPKAVRIAY